MKHRIYFILTILLSNMLCSFAQQNRMNCVSGEYDYLLDVQRAKLEVVNNQVVISIHLLARQDVPARQSVILVPELQDTISERVAEFPVIYINSRNQQIFYEREIQKYIKDAVAVRKYNGKNLQIDYLKSIPYQKWMETAVLKLRKLSCGCNVSTERGEEWLCSLREREMQVELFPAYRVPKAEAVKNRQEKGSALLRFKVDKWDILPDYMTNSAELKKIYATIDLVKNDPNVTIKRMTIDGYASPEGNQPHNQMLSDNRTNALRDYLYQIGLFPGINIIARGMGENWTGFRKELNGNTSIPQRDILQSIASQNISDDEKEGQMKKAATEGFAYCLRNIFPSLRCTNYAVEYTVRAFTLEESEQIFETRPINLSLNEIYRLADKYKNNPGRYNAIMQKASLLYPDDAYVNLTMAYLAIKRKAADEAEMYLRKVPADWKEARLNQAIVSYLRGRISADEIYRIQQEYQR